MDYRSDTFTLPTEEMKKAMISSPLGDDVYQEDPTVNKLEEFAADLSGKESSLFVPTCTMANLLAVATHCDHRLSEIIVGNKQHIHQYEVGGIASLASVHSSVLPNNSDGTLDLDRVKGAIRDNDHHYPFTKLVTIENTNNVCGGRILPEAYLDALSNLTSKQNIPIHMDGARVMNAVAATEVPLKSIARNIDSVSICLSKGLSAPAGAVLVGQKKFIESARHLRKALGGGMRQAGVLAACGLVALSSLARRLQEDNFHAHTLASKLHTLEGISVANGVTSVETNIIYLNVEKGSAVGLVESLKENGVLVGQYGTDMLRLVTHKDVDISNVDFVVSKFHNYFKSI